MAINDYLFDKVIKLIKFEPKQIFHILSKLLTIIVFSFKHIYLTGASKLTFFGRFISNLKS